MFTWWYIYLCCINIALLSITLVGFYVLGLSKPFLTLKTFPWDIFFALKCHLGYIFVLFRIYLQYNASIRTRRDYMIQRRGALIHWTLVGAPWDEYQQELQGPWLVSGCSACPWYLHALCNCDSSLFWYFNFGLYEMWTHRHVFVPFYFCNKNVILFSHNWNKVV